MSPSTQNIHIHLQERLFDNGYRMVVECHPVLYRAFSEKNASRLAKLPGTAAWVLFGATPEIQKWFANKHLPCVVTGGLHNGVRLPNVEFDLPACSRHAANLLLSRNHERIVFLAPHPMTAGDDASAHGFLEAARAWRTPVEAKVVPFDGSPQDLCRQLDMLLLHPRRPTGFLVAWAEHTVTVLSHLRHRNLRFPDDAAVISRSYEVFLDYCVPSVASYRMDKDRFIKHMLDVLWSQIEQGPGTILNFKIMPEFIPGESLGTKLAPSRH
jgi:DNA-binding LacI/PurR family transcriptional regulator